MTGVDTTNIDTSSFIDELIGNRDGNTVRVPANLVAAQFAAETPGPNYETRALLFADLDWPAGTRGAVWGDATEALRGIYTKSGASGAGSWARIGDLPMASLTAAQLATKASNETVSLGSIIRMTGSVGTANDITAEIDPAQAQIPQTFGQRVQVPWPATNTGPASLNGFVIKRRDGSNLAAGDLLGGTRLDLVVHNTDPIVYRLMGAVAIGDITGLTGVLAAETTAREAGVADAKQDAAEALNEAMTAGAAAAVADGKAVAAQGGIAGHVARVDNPHGTTKGQLGLSNVDNTADADKPVSAAQALADLNVQAVAQTMPAVGQDFHGGDTDPAAVDVDRFGFSAQMVDESGFAVQPTRAEFHAGDEGGSQLSFADAAGNIGIMTDEHGFPVTPARGEFYSSDDDATIAYAAGVASVMSFDANGFPIAPVRQEFYASDSDVAGFYEVDSNGAVVRELSGAQLADTGTPWTAYEVDGALRVVSEVDRPSADLGALTFKGSAGGTGHFAKAIVSDPLLGSARVVAVLPDEPWLVPVAPRIMYAILGLGQSLMYGNFPSVDDGRPATQGAVVFHHEDGFVPIRAGVDGSRPAVDVAKLIGFQALSLPEVLATSQSPLESMSLRMSRFCEERGIPWSALAFVTALGGTAYDGLKKGTQTYQNMLDGLAKAKELAESQGMQLVVLCAAIKHGEADASDPAYPTYLIEWQEDVETDVKAITGQDAPVPFISTQPSTFVTATPYAALGFAEVHLASDRHHLAGADYAVVDEYLPDQIHPDGAGAYHIGEYLFLGTLEALFTASKKSRPVRMVSATRSGTAVTVTYDIASGPLVLDDGPYGARAGEVRGFRYFDHSGQIAIVDVTVSGPNTLTITLASEPSGTSERIDYALMPQTSPRTEGNTPRGSVRDSSAELSHLDDRPLFNWAIHQRINL